MRADAVKVTLEWHEALLAAMQGVLRGLSSLWKNRENRHGMDSERSWDGHINGAFGEYVVAKHFGVWSDPSIDSFKAPDVAGFQVRCRSEDWHELIVRDDDADGEIFILVVMEAATPPVFWIVGWCTGERAKAMEEWRKTHGGREAAAFVPQEELSSMYDLKIGGGS